MLCVGSVNRIDIKWKHATMSVEMSFLGYFSKLQWKPLFHDYSKGHVTYSRKFLS